LHKRSRGPSQNELPFISTGFMARVVPLRREISPFRANSVMVV
jgi:hypothetical protein